MFNTATDIPCIEESRLPSYDLQYILLPLRPILSNQAIDYAGFLSEGTAEAIYLRARQTLLLMLDGALQFNKHAHGLTYVANFLVPPVPAMGAASPHESIRDLTSIVRRLNNDLAARVGGYRNVAVADVDAVANALGKSDALDDGMTFAAHAMVLRAFTAATLMACAA